MILEYRIADIVHNWKNKARDRGNVPSANRGVWIVQGSNSTFLKIEKLKTQSSKCSELPRFTTVKKKSSSPLNVFLSESGVSKCKEFRWTGAICLIWRTRCNVLFKALGSGSLTDTVAVSR